MRMWMVDPKILCRQHLMGEHNECHAFLGTFRKKTKVEGYVRNNLLEITSLQKRHDELAKEMQDRGYHHKSNLDFSMSDVNYLSEQIKNYIIDRRSSFDKLIERCSICKSRYEEIKGNLNDNKSTN